MSLIVAANLVGSSALTGNGRPWATSQNGQRRVQIAPKIIKVAVPWLKHSDKFGQDASSHTEFRLCLRIAPLISSMRAELLGSFTRNHFGFLSTSAFSCSTTLTGM